MEINEQMESQKTQEKTDQAAIQSITRLLRDHPVKFLIGVVAALIFIAWIAPTAFIDLLKVLISWPLVAAILIIAFKKDIAEFIQYLVIRYRTKSGDEFSFSSQRAARAFESATAESKKEPGPADTQALKDQIEKLIHIADVSVQEKQHIVQTAIQLLEQKHREVIYWWFQYLSHALVFKTKLVLSWFADQRTGISQETYKVIWKPLIPEPEELEAVFFALLDHGLIAADDAGLLWVTGAGRDFLDFLRLKGFPGASS
jgi:hypothetical protein